ncbi:hypothetical protein GUITHDRAFT_99988 [Guillardia theta CCMP2712]|uniref:Uncharacterized protein n=1 Tax=Guillardia theta (strain CCMP2712) TaxID=905079 RepID=L1K231_GUITC|nr:hypothetical protein GUITHDRAFT_99988 [Guillardia theta CCMP2712]EKX54510.1 hypothetical protein GUITHDRAFT_99988 [Guillardia theta CCMP2712]|eukprot:XP_005841490.1 hypothetical protein GUITHDRAFT_99988 [Guillardia theta CCMP2712]
MWNLSSLLEPFSKAEAHVPTMVSEDEPPESEVWRVKIESVKDTIVSWAFGEQTSAQKVCSGQSGWYGPVIQPATGKREEEKRRREEGGQAECMPRLPGHDEFSRLDEASWKLIHALRQQQEEKEEWPPRRVTAAAMQVLKERKGKPVARGGTRKTTTEVLPPPHAPPPASVEPEQEASCSKEEEEPVEVEEGKHEGFLTPPGSKREEVEDDEEALYAWIPQRNSVKLLKQAKLVTKVIQNMGSVDEDSELGHSFDIGGGGGEGGGGGSHHTSVESDEEEDRFVPERWEKFQHLIPRTT